MNFVKFFYVLAWVFGILSFLLIAARIAGYFWYHSVRAELERGIDVLCGRNKRFPTTVPGIIFIVCLTYILTS